NAHVAVIAEPEVQAVNALLRGDAGIAFLARELTEEERAHFDKRSVNGRVYPVGYDAIVCVTDSASTETGIRVADVTNMLTGDNYGNKQLVFDDLYSSTLRELIDIGDIDRVANTYVLTSAGSEEVLKEVSASTDTIGAISF